VHCAQGRVLIALSGDQRLSVVQRRWPLELRARQVVEAYRERHDRRRRRRARQVFRPRQLGRASPRAEDARRRTDERRLRRRLVRNGGRRHPRQCGRDPRQDELHSRRRGEAPLRIASAFTGKATIALVGDKIERFIDVDLVSGDNVVPFCGRRRLGPRRLRRRADPSPARRWGEAHARPHGGIAWFAIDRGSHALVSVSGAPIEPDPAVARGYAIERSFYKLDGTKLDALQSMAQNERVVVSLKVTEAQARYARLLVVDRLPAGLEIDNPALVDGGSVEAFSRLSRDVEPAHTRNSNSATRAR
jgi:Bacterial Alpha-2-macroglobulin MG10 domain